MCSPLKSFLSKQFSFLKFLCDKKRWEELCSVFGNFKAFELEFRTSFGHQKVVLFWISSQNCICLHSSFSEFLTKIQNLQKNNIVLTSKKHWFSFFCYKNMTFWWRFYRAKIHGLKQNLQNFVFWCRSLLLYTILQLN